MGVLACNRAGCENIMCRRYSDEFGYICRECFDELEASNTLDIEEFMDKPKSKHPPGVIVDYDAMFPIGD